MKLGQLVTAKESLEYARRHAKAAGMLAAEIAASTMLAEVELGRGNMDLAFAALEDIWELFDRAPYRVLHAEAMNVKAAIDMAAGDLASAAISARRAYELAWCDGPPYAYHSALTTACRHIVQLGLPEASRDCGKTGVAQPLLQLDLSIPEAFWQAVKADRLEREMVTKGM